ncbi:ATPase [Sporosarcina sp. CAU 1771]
MGKTLWIPLSAAFGTMIVLYLIGAIANIDILHIKLSLTHTEISFIPVFAGMLVGFISERILKAKFRD